MGITPGFRVASWQRRARRFWPLLLAALILIALAWLVARELRTSTLQARFLAAWARELRFDMHVGPSPANRYPQAGPFDERAGYTRIPAWTDRLAARDWTVSEQARQSEPLVRFAEQGFFPPYREKTQLGLGVIDCRGATIFQARSPQQAYPSYEAIPPLLVKALGFIENRELITNTEPHHNPALEWPRLGRALMDQAIALADPAHPAAGGSTLATQIEKFRHSPDGRTASVTDKYRQLVSASVRAYAEGENTQAVRQRILLDYLNNLPLGAQRQYGEVIGILDGLSAWYGANATAVNQLLRAPLAAGGDPAPQAQALRQVLSLLIAQRRPSAYLGAGSAQLAALTDSYLRLLATEGVIEPALRDAALRVRLPVLGAFVAGAAGVEVADRKAAHLLRVELSSLLDTPRLYDLDRLDLGAASTIDAALQTAVTEHLHRLRQPEGAKAAGLIGPQLLERGDPRQLLYSVTLLERGEGMNKLRVQTDNLDQPFDINAGAKLELGSTAKLRTLVTYLEVIASLHDQFSPLSAQALSQLALPRRDRLARWAAQYLATTADRSLAAMLRAAMARTYSASPAETFYTGSGAHTFSNFDPRDNGRTLSVEAAFHDSVNLVFIRLMRDVVHHYLSRGPLPADQILAQPDHPQRAVLLARFADREGSRFIRTFHAKYQRLAGEQALQQLVAGIKPTPVRLAVIYRSWAPQAPVEDFAAFLAHQLPGARLSDAAVQSLYQRHGPDSFSLADRGYLAHVHPLELWVAAYLRQHPQATLDQVIGASAQERHAVYGWLFRTRAVHAQDTRILSLLESDAFVQIHRSWKRLGYPFDSLVPSYATAIGSSGDRPAALAELVGILVNEGMRMPTVQVEALHFAAGTPYETVIRKQARSGERVIAPEVASTVRRAMAGVVEHGTARRFSGALTTPQGAAVVVGGKTGTGDNRLETYGPRGTVLGSRVINRTATFVFFIGDRYFGSVTAYVPGSAAQAFRFTSALPVQVLKSLAPQLKPLADPLARRACDTVQ